MSSLKEIISYGHIENKRMYPHRNPGMEIVLVDQGRLDWAVDQAPEILNSGTVFFTLPWQVHGSLKVCEPRNRIFYTLFALPQPSDRPVKQLRMPSSLGFSSAEEKLVGRVLVSTRRHAWPASDLLKKLFPALMLKLDGTTQLEAAAARALLRTIIIELAGIIDSAPDAPQRESASASRVRGFLKSLLQTMDHPWSLAEMAEACSVKRSRFANITKQITGYPPVQYLGRLRFEKACELLRASNRSITDIAFECGYGSSQYFAETFKRFARMTPSDYRRHLPELDAIMACNWNHPEDRSIADERRRADLIK